MALRLHFIKITLLQHWKPFSFHHQNGRKIDFWCYLFFGPPNKQYLKILGLKELEILDLSNNNLQNIGHIRFEETISLQVLRLNGNRLNSDSISRFFKTSEKYFPHLKELGLSNNQITTWSNKILLKELTFLRLNHNYLQQWNSCKTYPNLQ